MKKIILLAFACSFFALLSANAQIKKGSVLFGGGISGGSSTTETGTGQYKTTSFFLYPSIGLAVSENSVAGLNISYGHIQTKVAAVKTSNENDYGAGFFYRRYLPLGKNFYLFGEGGIGYSHSKRDETPNPPDPVINRRKLNSAQLSFYPGLAYAVNKRIHLEVSMNSLVGFSYTTASYESINTPVSTPATKGHQFNFSTNVSASAPLTVGFRIVLGK